MITRKVRPPRSLLLPFPFGYPLGRPNDLTLQRQIVLEALTMAVEATTPGDIRESTFMTDGGDRR